MREIKPNLNVVAKAGKVFLAFERVSYGKKGTPKGEREYRIVGIIPISPVGTRKEIKGFMHKIILKDKFNGVVLIDKKDGDPVKDFQEFILTDDL